MNLIWIRISSDLDDNKKLFALSCTNFVITEDTWNSLKKLVWQDLNIFTSSQAKHHHKDEVPLHLFCYFLYNFFIQLV